MSCEDNMGPDWGDMDGAIVPELDPKTGALLRLVYQSAEVDLEDENEELKS